ncbi:MAG: hypothetical protein ACTSO7_14520 [Candidatus Heimdallarchaeota archaeon]
MDLIEYAKVNLNEALNSPLLPEKAKKDLEGFGDTLLTVYSKKSKTLKFIPTNDDVIWWINVAIDSFSPETSGKMLIELNKHVNEFLYSTGVCVSKSECFWDGIVLESSLKSTKDAIINAIEEIPSVSQVSIKVIE